MFKCQNNEMKPKAMSKKVRAESSEDDGHGQARVAHLPAVRRYIVKYLQI